MKFKSKNCLMKTSETPLFSYIPPICLKKKRNNTQILSLLSFLGTTENLKSEIDT